MASRSRPTPSEWAAKRQAAIEIAKIRRESERLGEITSQHTFRPTLRSSTPIQSSDAEVNWQSSSAEWVAKRRATLKAASDKKDVERGKEAQSLRRRSPSNRSPSRNLRNAQSPGRSPRCLKGGLVNVMARCVSPVSTPQRSRTPSNVDTHGENVKEPLELAPIASKSPCVPVCIAQKFLPSLTTHEVVATASPLRLVAHERVRRAKSPMKSPRPQDVEEALASKLADSAVFVAIGPAASVPTRGPLATTEDAEPSHTIGSEPPYMTKHVAPELQKQDVASSNAALLSPDIGGSHAPRSSLGHADVPGAEILMPSPDAKVEGVAASHMALPSSTLPCSDSVLSPRSGYEGRRISWSQIAVHTDDACSALVLPC